MFVETDFPFATSELCHEIPKSNHDATIIDDSDAILEKFDTNVRDPNNIEMSSGDGDGSPGYIHNDIPMEEAALPNERDVGHIDQASETHDVKPNEVRGRSGIELS